MPLTLECACPGNLAVSVCEVVSAKFVVDTFFTSAGYVANVNVALYWGGSLLNTIAQLAGDVSDASGHFEFPLSLGTVMDNWDTLRVYFAVGASLFQPPGGGGCSWMAVYKLVVTYTCNDQLGNTVTVERTFLPNESDSDTDTSPGFLRSWAYITRGAAAGGILGSSGLSPAFSEVDAGLFGQKPPDDTISVDDSQTGTVCLCATGGTEPYFYYVVSGSMPAGTWLNQDTGCLNGDASGPTNGPTTFGVTDAAGDQATVVCDLFSSCANPNELAVGNAFY